MKKIYTILLLSCCYSLTTTAQTLIPTTDELVLPQYTYQGSTAGARIHYVCRLKLSGLLPSATYRYFTGLSVQSTGYNTAQVAGQSYQIRNTAALNGGNIDGFTVTRAINSSQMSGNLYNTGTTSYHARFTTNATGEYTGWFAVVSVYNATHTPIGGDAFFYIQMNDGGTGTALTQSYRTTSTIKILGLSSSSDSATALIGTSDVGNEKFVSLFDNTSFSGRPIATSFTENDSLAHTAWTTWYGPVNATPGSWGTVIPNNLATGIRGIKFYEADGTEITLSNSPTPNISNNGVWNGVSTVNLSGGPTAVTINSIAGSTVPITLLSFTGLAKNDGIHLNWVTGQEINNKYFELSRSNDGRNFKAIATIDGSRYSLENKSYNYIDQSPENGANYYQLKQVDINGKSTTFNIVTVKFITTNEALNITGINDYEVNVSLKVTTPQTGSILYMSSDGRILFKKMVNLSSGININIPVSKSQSNIGIISYVSGSEIKTIKTLRF
jgi:hypothetical protein